MNRHTAVERCNMGGQIDKSNTVSRKDVLISQFFLGSYLGLET
jgi:hypothetical protein